MKKTLSVIIAIIMVLSVFSLTSCKKTENSDETTAPEVTSSGDVTTDNEDTTVGEDEAGSVENGTNSGTSASGKEETTKKTESNSASGNKSDETTTKKNTSSNSSSSSATSNPTKTGGKVYLHAGTAEAKPGDTVDVYLGVENCRLFACADIIFSLSGNGTISSYGKNNDIDDLYAEASNKSASSVAVALFVTTTVALKGDDLYHVTVKVSDSAKKGDVITLKAALDTFSVGTNSSGDTINNIVSSLSSPSFIITVK